MSNARNLGNITTGGATGATTASVTTSINNLIDAAPGALNTLNELAAALGDDANFSTTVTNSIATKLPLAGGTMTGDLVVTKNSAAIQVNESSGATTKLVAGGSLGYVGTYSNHNLQLLVDGTPKVIIDTDGDVGIGTTNPATQLHIDEGTSNTYATIRLEGNNRGGDIEMYQGTVPVSTIRTDQSGNMYFKTSGAYGNTSVDNRLTILTGGNVGIGKDSPASKLHIKANTNGYDGAVQIEDNSGSTKSAITHVGGVLYISSNATNDHMSIIANGNVGIGETSPGRMLHIQAKGTSTVDNAAILFENEVGTTGEIRQGPASDNALIFTENGQERLRITSGGNIGIGAQIPQCRVNIYGASTSNWADSDAMYNKDHPAFLKITNGQETVGVESGIVMRSKTTGAGVWSMYAKQTANYLADLHFRGRNAGTTSAVRLTLKSDGNVGIGTTDPGQLLEVNGSGATIRVESTDNNQQGIEFYQNNTKNASIMWGQGSANLEIKNFRNDQHANNLYANIDFFTGGSNATSSGSPAYTPDLVMRLTDDGNVGIGTTSPATQLHVHNSSGNGSVQITSQAGATSFINMGDVDDADIGQISYVNSDDSMRFKAGNGERMRINGNGIVNFLQDGSSSTQAYTSAGYAQAYIFRFAMNMTGNVAYNITMTGFGNGIIRVMCQASHWTGGYMTYRESMIGMDSYAGYTENNLNYANSGAQGNWSFSRPASGKFRITKSAGTYVGGMLSTMIIIGPRNVNIESVT